MKKTVFTFLIGLMTFCASAQHSIYFNPSRFSNRKCFRVCRYIRFLLQSIKVSGRKMPPVPISPTLFDMRCYSLSSKILSMRALSSFTSESTHSVVNNNPEIEAAFSRATRVTLVGSITPAA